MVVPQEPFLLKLSMTKSRIYCNTNILEVDQKMNINFSKQTCSLKKFVLFSLYVRFSTGSLDKVTIFVIKQNSQKVSF